MRRAWALLLLAPLAAPGTASAQMSHPNYRGVTGQGHDVALHLRTTGAPQTVWVEWDARCRRGTRFAVQETRFLPRVDDPPPGIVDGVARYRVAARRGRIAQVTVVIRGRVRGDPARPATLRWSGTLRVRATMRRHGRLEDRCSLRTRWRAGPEGIGAGVWEMARDPANEPEPSAWRSHWVSAWGSPGNVVVGAGDGTSSSWLARFGVLPPNRLQSGRTYTTSTEPPSAWMRLSGPFDAWCSGVPGSFTVERIAFDDLRRLSLLRVRFELRCRSGDRTVTVRGTIDWRATA